MTSLSPAEYVLAVSNVWVSVGSSRLAVHCAVENAQLTLMPLS